jgi:hypothetical protein
MTVLLAVAGLTLAPAAVAAQTRVSGQGTAAVVTTPATGTQQFATALLPSGGGMADSGLDNVGVGTTLGATGLAAITTGMVDTKVVSAQTSAEAANVSILNGLITAEQVVALAASYADGLTAASDAEGSSLLGLVVNGVSLGDLTPAPNTRIDLPGTGYVVLNEQVRTGDGVTRSGLTVNMIHVYQQSLIGAVLDPLTGQLIGGTLTTTAEIIVGSAASAVGP